MEIIKWIVALHIILYAAVDLADAEEEEDCDDEDRVIQTCYFCQIDGYNDEISVSSPSECEGYLTNTYQMATYDKTTGQCRLSESSSEPVSVTTEENITYRLTCNTDCTVFSVESQTGTQVDESTYMEDENYIENCFFWCMNTPNCRMAFQRNSYSDDDDECRIYTTCDTSCDTSSTYSSLRTTYWRYCYDSVTDCGFDTSNVFGVLLSYSGSTTYTGSIVTYTCEYPYVTANTNQHTCQADGTWSNEEFKCDVPDCGPPGNISSGSVSYTNTTWNSMAYYSCEIGHDLGRLTSGGWWFATTTTWEIFSGEVTCEDSGAWSVTTSDMLCVIRDCGDPGNLQNGDEIKSTFTYGSEVSFYCNSGYDLSVNTTLVCDENGNWDGVFPTCIIKDCGQPVSISYGNVYNTLTTFTEVVQYTCDASSGYELIGSDTLVCGADGNWSGPVPTCSLVDCGTLSAPENGSINLSGTLFGSVATFECATGFDMVGSSVRGCEFNGWNNSQPVCNPKDCGNILAPVNGDISFPDTTYGNVATYTCNTDYDMNGSATRECLADGNWNSTAPTCDPKDCGSLSAPDNGTILMPGTTYGFVATFSCDSGYDLNGATTIQCMSDGNWNSTAPTCDPKDCGSMSAPGNGTIQIPGTTYGFVATFSCDSGYDLNGASTIQCMSDGNWNSTAPTCDPKDCGSLSAPGNGTIQIPGTTYGFVATFSCDSGYDLNGATTIQCMSDGNWNSTAPTCDPKDCGSMSAPGNGTIQIPGTTYGFVLTFSCDSGYDLSGSTTIQCMSDGNWNSTAPTCDPKDCGSMSAPGNGTIQLPGTTYGFVATVSCDSGYDLNGASTIHCMSDGNWNSTAPTCDPKDCGSLSAPGNGTIQIPVTTYGFVATFSCDSGYDLNGSTTIQCMYDGNWNSTAPTCDPKDCGSMSAPGNGTIQIPGTTYGFVSTFSCDSGYDLSGSTTIQCMSDGNWNSTAPTCDPKDCASMSAPGNGTIQIPGTTYGFVSIFSCDSGYDLSGATTIQCMSDGNWNSTAPTCDPKDCGSLSAPGNGTIQIPGTTYGFVSIFSCDSGYDLSGATTVQCMSDGNWNSTAPTCDLKDCGSLSAPGNGTILIPGTTYGIVATFSCDSGYDLSGATTIQCMSDGNWNSTAPTCDPKDCGSLSAPGNGTIQIADTTYGYQVIYTCNAGYSINGNATRLCSADGNWSETTPVCDPIECGLLSAPGNGSIVIPGTSFGFSVSYSCNSGYELNVTVTRQCLSDGNWSDDAPYCNPKDCGLLMNPSHGTVFVGYDTTYLNVATYNCSAGYSLTGSPVRQCESTGLWEGVSPNCTEIECSALTSPANGQVTLAGGTGYNAIATYTCNTGYVVQGVSSRRCQSDSVWSGAKPSCVTEESAATKKSIYISPCICYRNKTFTNMTQEEIISFLIAQTAIDVTNTSSARSRLMCRGDPRASAATLGMMGVGMLVFVGLLVIGVDCIRVWKYFSTENKQDKYMDGDEETDEEQNSD